MKKIEVVLNGELVTLDDTTKLLARDYADETGFLLTTSELHHVGETYYKVEDEEAPTALSDIEVRLWLEGYVVESAEEKQTVTDILEELKS